MKQQTERLVEDYIQSLNMDGLAGRMLYIPGPKTKRREILLVYGHHSSLERWWGLAQSLQKYGALTMPDLPGFGGMDSLYKHGEAPTIDALADYLAAFIKLRYRHKKVTIVGVSFGFVVVTRMLQRCPELIKKVDGLVSIVGFARYDDFTLAPARRFGYVYGSWFLSHRLPAFFFKQMCLQPWILRLIYGQVTPQTGQPVDAAQRRLLVNAEVALWRTNEVRTHMRTTFEFLRLDNCQKQIGLPLWHVSVPADHYFDSHVVEQHLRVIFSDVRVFPSKLVGHVPNVIASLEMTDPILPPALRRLLAKASV